MHKIPLLAQYSQYDTSGDGAILFLIVVPISLVAFIMTLLTYYRILAIKENTWQTTELLREIRDQLKAEAAPTITQTVTNKPEPKPETWYGPKET